MDLLGGCHGRDWQSRPAKSAEQKARTAAAMGVAGAAERPKRHTPHTRGETSMSGVWVSRDTSCDVPRHAPRHASA